MKSLAFGITAALAIAGTALAQVPSTNDTSDPNGNTAMGSGTLGGPAASNSGSYNTASGGIALHANTSGSYNTASGAGALYSNTTGNQNTASGFGALYFNTTGNNNTASGDSALYANTTGNGNTASGLNALALNTTGSGNSAYGLEALYSNTTGYSNTASGLFALYSNTTGYNNTAIGIDSLYSNTTGVENVAAGVETLFQNTVGYRNTAIGNFALQENTTGTYNNAIGYSAMAYNTTGQYNNAQGYLALENNTIGNNNIAIGQYAGYYLTTGSYNIDIGNFGVAGESGAIRIGTSYETSTFIAGISTSTLTGAAVYVSSSGQLGVLASSERYKTAVLPMGANTDKLQKLRPVTFHLKTDPKGDVQYGLIAEEVAQVYPELVIRDQGGQIQGVRYEELAPMLLNEVQKQATELGELRKQLAEMHAALLKLQSREPFVARR